MPLTATSTTSKEKPASLFHIPLRERLINGFFTSLVYEKLAADKRIHETPEAAMPEIISHIFSLKVLAENLYVGAHVPTALNLETFKLVIILNQKVVANILKFYDQATPEEKGSFLQTLIDTLLRMNEVFYRLYLLNRMIGNTAESDDAFAKMIKPPNAGLTPPALETTIDLLAQHNGYKMIYPTAAKLDFLIAGEECCLALAREAIANAVFKNEEAAIITKTKVADVKTSLMELLRFSASFQMINHTDFLNIYFWKFENKFFTFLHNSDDLDIAERCEIVKYVKLALEALNKLILKHYPMSSLVNFIRDQRDIIDKILAALQAEIHEHVDNPTLPASPTPLPVPSEPAATEATEPPVDMKFTQLLTDFKNCIAKSKNHHLQTLQTVLETIVNTINHLLALAHDINKASAEQNTQLINGIHFDRVFVGILKAKLITTFDKYKKDGGNMRGMNSLVKIIGATIERVEIYERTAVQLVQAPQPKLMSASPNYAG